MDRVPGSDPGPLLRPLSKAGRVLARRLSTGAVLTRVVRLSYRADVNRFSPHDARRTLISWLLDSGADLATVQRLAGRAEFDTTVAYDRRGDVAKRQAVDRMPFPDVKLT